MTIKQVEESDKESDGSLDEEEGEGEVEEAIKIKRDQCTKNNYLKYFLKICLFSKKTQPFCIRISEIQRQSSLN